MLAIFLWIGIVGIFWFFKLNINLTPSMPLGIWRETDHLKKGDFVAFCLPHNHVMAFLIEDRGYLPRGRCSNGFAPLLKKIVAVEGDVVDLKMDFVSVNGQRFYHSATLLKDSESRLMQYIPRGRYIVSENTYWVLATDHPRSLDSRYFGAIPKSAILHAMKPVMIFYRYHGLSF